MRIAFLITSLTKTAPIIIAASIIKHIKDKCEVEVFYFKDILEMDMGVPTRKLDFFTPFSFENFDILHTHLFRPDMYVRLHRKQIKCKTISTVHAFIREDIFSIYSFPKNYLITYAWYKALPAHDALVCLTNSMTADYQRRYPAEKIYTVNNGIEPDTHDNELTPEEEKQIQEIKREYKIIGTTSSLISRKGLEIIISFLTENKNYAWYATGKGKREQALKKLAAQSGVGDRCFFAGFKKNVSAFYPLFDIFAMPSRSEGFGLGIVEAAMHKCPILCSNIEVFTESFSKEEVAFFKLDDLNSFSEAVKQLEANPETYGSNAYKKMQERYTAPVMAESYLSVYKELIKG